MLLVLDGNGTSSGDTVYFGGNRSSSLFYGSNLSVLVYFGYRAFAAGPFWCQAGGNFGGEFFAFSNFEGAFTVGQFDAWLFDGNFALYFRLVCFDSNHRFPWFYGSDFPLAVYRCDTFFVGFECKRTAIGSAGFQLKRSAVFQGDRFLIQGDAGLNHFDFALHFGLVCFDGNDGFTGFFGSDVAVAVDGCDTGFAASECRGAAIGSRGL